MARQESEGRGFSPAARAARESRLQPLKPHVRHCCARVLQGLKPLSDGWPPGGGAEAPPFPHHRTENLTRSHQVSNLKTSSLWSAACPGGIAGRWPDAATLPARPRRVGAGCRRYPIFVAALPAPVPPRGMGPGGIPGCWPDGATLPAGCRRYSEPFALRGRPRGATNEYGRTTLDRQHGDFLVCHYSAPTSLR
jgi:hypothetical protein